MPNGTRRGHMRNGHPVRATSIKGRKAPRKRLNAGARRRAQSKPLLLAAGTLAGLGALDAILTGRWGGALVLGFGALCFGVGHLAWSHHKSRQTSKPVKPVKPQAQQRREALEKARVAQPAPATSNGTVPASHEEWQTRYGRRCDCTKCRASRRSKKAATVEPAPEPAPITDSGPAATPMGRRAPGHPRAKSATHEHPSVWEANGDTPGSRTPPKYTRKEKREAAEQRAENERNRQLYQAKDEAKLRAAAEKVDR